ncbi:Glyoxalase/Bleomycin resistance protein/Dihydroxybiphenyl dioxygenase [Biscogniauxia marginata]|nr:Glyoxalase/Bleomycin resistance protein/Dihydroxybiphenyl dioxygenase [Biscogniauxia marginata]
MRVPTITNSSSKVQLARISHVYLEHPDLDKFENFAKDFGFVEAGRAGDTIYYRGFGRDPYVYVASQARDGVKAFKGAAFVAQTEEDFVKATKLQGATRVDISKAPGGGQAVSVPTPGGSKIYVVWNQQEREVREAVSATTVTKGDYNTSLEKFRKGQFQRFQPGPAMVHKLGHYGFVTAVFDDDVRFYTSNFNFTPSDILYSPGNNDEDVIVFLHLDLGADYSDHHSLFFQRVDPGQTTRMHHCSFEVDDFDTQLLGHEHLLSKGYTPAWGVGRHILGSQIFDYWKDTSGFLIEHYADGDLVNQNTQVTREEAGPGKMNIWGAPFPPGLESGGD